VANRLDPARRSPCGLCAAGRHPGRPRPDLRAAPPSSAVPAPAGGLSARHAAATDHRWAAEGQETRSVVRSTSLRCVELYERASINLAEELLVGVGSVCRRQATGEIEVIVHSLAAMSLRLHGFGVKTRGMIRYADCLTSADSLAWSFEARRAAPLPGCRHANCANCLRYTAEWWERALGAAGRREDAPADGGVIEDEAPPRWEAPAAGPRTGGHD
jgi:hypothetical protein